MTAEHEEQTEHSPEQIEHSNYWVEVLERRMGVDESANRTRQEAKEIASRMEAQVKRREDLGWPNPNLCETCRFIPGKCPQSEVNAWVGKGKEITPVHFCDYYDPGVRHTDPPNLPAEERVQIVLHLETDRNDQRYLIVTFAEWVPKKNDYVIKKKRGRRDGEGKNHS